MSTPFTKDEGPLPPQILKTPAEVYSSLRTLHESNTPLLLSFTERRQCYQTFLVNINREKGWIAIDELVPNDGERLLIAGEAFQIEGLHEGVRIAWTNEHPAHASELDDAPCYWIPLPREIQYHQRRSAYRAQLMGQPINAILNGRTIKTPLVGTMLDMSATGCKLSFKGDIQDRLQTGQIYERFSATLPFGTVTTEVELRHLAYDDKTDTTFCGLRFYRISGMTQRQVERFVYQMQREARRDQVVDRFD